MQNIEYSDYYYVSKQFYINYDNKKMYIITKDKVYNKILNILAEYIEIIGLTILVLIMLAGIGFKFI